MSYTRFWIAFAIGALGFLLFAAWASDGEPWTKTAARCEARGGVLVRNYGNGPNLVCAQRIPTRGD